MLYVPILNFDNKQRSVSANMFAGGTLSRHVCSRHINIISYLCSQDVSRRKNPDEAVARGAAWMGALCHGPKSDISTMEFSDVTPLSLGISIKGNIMSTIIKRNSTIPVKRSSTYVTTKADQTEIFMGVFEGERPVADQNHQIGSLTLHGLPKMPRGMATALVTFEINYDGVLLVTAYNEQNNKSEHVNFKNHGNHSPETIEAMIKTAQSFRDDDEKRVKIAQIMNEMDQLVHDLTNETGSGDEEPDRAGKLGLVEANHTNWLQGNQNPSVEQCLAQLEKLKNMSK